MKPTIPNLPDAEPDDSFVRDTRRAVLAHVAQHRRQRHSVRAGWVAGGAVVAAALVMLLVLPTSNTSFAQVQRLIDSARTIQFTSTLVVTRDGQVMPLSSARSWADRERGARLDVDVLNVPLIQVRFPAGGDPFLLDHTHRAAIPLKLPEEIDPQELLRFDPATLVRRLGAAAGDITMLPTTDADRVGFGVPATAVGLSDDSTIELWADARTMRPVQITAVVPTGEHETVTWTLHDFRWDEPIDDAQLELAVPAGYEWIDALVVPTPGEDALLRTLERFAQLKNGRFPSSQMVAWESLVKIITVALQPTSSWTNLPEPLNTERGQRRALGDAIAGGLFYLQLADRGARPQYFGGRVRLGDDATLLSWKQSDGTTRRVTGKLESETTP